VGIPLGFEDEGSWLSILGVRLCCCVFALIFLVRSDQVEVG